MQDNQIANPSSASHTKEGLFVERVRQEFPDIKWSTHRYVTHGWDHEVLVLDEEIIMRTPRDRDSADEMQKEIGLLNYLKGKVPVGIPDYKYVSKDRTIAGYKMLPGHDLWDGEVFRAMSEDDKQTFAKALAGFLAVLHSTPESVIQQLNPRREDPRSCNENLRRNVEPLLQPRLTASEFDVLAAHLEELHEALDDDYPNVMTHCDLRAEHILWDERSKRTSVIDFADFALADPAVDFAWLFEFGAGFARRVYDLYQGKKDSRLLHRAELYFKRDAPDIMVMSLQGFPCTFEEGYEMFRDRFLGGRK